MTTFPRGPGLPVLLRVVLTLGFLLPAVTKFLPEFGWVGRFAGWGYPAWFVPVIGSLELLGVIGLWVPRARQGAVALLAAIMLGAIYTNVTHPPLSEIVRPVIFLALLGTLATVQRARATAT